MPGTAPGAPLQQLHQAGPVSSQQNLQDGQQAARGQPVQESTASQRLEQAQPLHTWGPGPVAEAVEGSGSSNLQLPFVLQSSSSQLPSRWACWLRVMQHKLGYSNARIVTAALQQLPVWLVLCVTSQLATCCARSLTHSKSCQILLLCSSRHLHMMPADVTFAESGPAPTAHGRLRSAAAWCVCLHAAGSHMPLLLQVGLLRGRACQQAGTACRAGSSQPSQACPAVAGEVAALQAGQESRAPAGRGSLADAQPLRLRARGRLPGQCTCSWAASGSARHQPGLRLPGGHRRG